MPFTTNLTGTTQVDNSIVQAYDASFISAHEQANVMDGFVEYRADIGAKSIEFPKYGAMALATTPLTETDDVTSVALSDSQVIFTPAEYGAAVTTTSLASLQTGGKVNLAAATQVGKNMASTRNKLATLALEASTNVITPGNTAEASLASTDIMSGVMLNRIYNKLARSSVPFTSSGDYVGFMHADVIADLQAEAGWVDVAKYANAVDVLRNEVGMYKGIRVVRNNHCLISADAGALAVDTYKSTFIGLNALGLAVSKEPGLSITGPFDKLGRFVNLGWYGVFSYGIVDTDAVWTAITASSVGANA